MLEKLRHLMTRYMLTNVKGTGQAGQVRESQGSQGMCTFEGNEGSPCIATHQKINDFVND